MSALTKNERDGLDDVFLSIHTHEDKYEKMKALALLLLSHETKINVKNLLKQAKHGLKETKFSQFLYNISKKKKNLSK